MLLSSWIFSEKNEGLTVDTIKWVLKNALNMSPNTLYAMKTALKADHPLMREESLYDDLPVEVQALFVMEPYFPRKHFDRAFAWLFGKESIAQINADDFSHYKRQAEKNCCYSSMRSWGHLPLTSDELSHLFNVFGQLPNVGGISQLTSCMTGLTQNASITPEIYEQGLLIGLHRPNYKVCAEVANRHIDKCVEAIKIKRQIDTSDVFFLGDSLRLENISRDRRDALLAELDMKDVDFFVVNKIYNNDIPDDVFWSLIENVTINEQNDVDMYTLIPDVRFPKNDATRIAFSDPQKYASFYLNRSDLDSDTRVKFITALTEQRVRAPKLKEIFSNLILDGLVTRSELKLAKRSIKNMPAPYYVSEFYDDVKLFVEAMECLYQNKRHPKKGVMKDLKSIEPSRILDSPHWTKDALLQLLEITRERPVDLNNLESQERFRQNILHKLFSESFYPSLDRDDLTGPYGRAENLLAHLLNVDAELLDEDDIKQIINSRIQLDYKDRDVDLAKSLANHPELNERIIAERLRLRVEQLNDTTLLARQRPAL